MTPVVNFINVFCAQFPYKILAPKISNPKYSFRTKFWRQKRAFLQKTRAMLMKLTPVLLGKIVLRVLEVAHRRIGLKLVFHRHNLLNTQTTKTKTTNDH